MADYLDDLDLDTYWDLQALQQAYRVEYINGKVTKGQTFNDWVAQLYNCRFLRYEEQIEAKLMR